MSMAIKDNVMFCAGSRTRPLQTWQPSCSGFWAVCVLAGPCQLAGGWLGGWVAGPGCECEIQMMQ